MSWRTRFVLGIVALGFSLVPTTKADAAIAPTAPRSPIASPSGSDMVIRWLVPTSSGSSALDYYTITASNQVTGFFGTLHACGACTSVTWPNLVLGGTYTFTLKVTNRDGVVSTMIATAATKVPTAGCTAATSPCATVDASKPGAINTFAAQGVLNSAASTPARLAYLNQLNLRNWRLNYNQPSRATYFSKVPAGAAVTAILYDAWQNYQRTAKTKTCVGALPVPANPWDDWSVYDSWVKSFVRAEEAAGRKPAYWEVMNEPNVTGFEAVTTCGNPATTDLVQAVFEHTYHAIKDNFANERVMAPSLMHLSPDNMLDKEPSDATFISLNRFLKWSSGRGLAWDAIAYHEDGHNNHTGNPNNDYLGRAQSVQTHLTSVRQLLANYPLLRNTKVFVNEYNSSGAFYGDLPTNKDLNVIPGRAAAFEAALTNGGVDGAGLSCWPDTTATGINNCWDDSIDGLLNPYSGLPRSVFYVYQRAGCMTGNVLPTGANTPSISVVSTLDQQTATVRTLLGRFDYEKYGPVSPVSIAVSAPSAIGATALVTIQQIPNSFNNTVDSLPVATTTTVPVVGGVVRVAIPAFADNDAYYVVVSPLGGSRSACDITLPS
jgi:hypothetical protein